MGSIDAVIFDMDGVLIDSEQVWDEVRRRFTFEAGGTWLPDAQLARYQGVLGHYHVQTNKVDPGPAFQWDRLIDEARRLMR